MTPADDASTFPVLRAADIPQEETPRRWLIEGLWGSSAVGIIGGTPKSLKTWTSQLEMVVSVATGPRLEFARSIRYWQTASTHTTCP
jgi:hypothetical protein